MVFVFIWCFIFVMIINAYYKKSFDIIFIYRDDVQSDGLIFINMKDFNNFVYKDLMIIKFKVCLFWV